MKPRLLISLWLAALLAAPRPAAAAASRLAVVAHPGRSADLTIGDIAQIFLKKRRFWADGSTILPVNREAISASRRAFTEAVFALQGSRLSVYWDRQYFHGVLPPTTLASDESVKRFVAAEPTAIGYIDAAAVDDSVRVILYLP